MSHSRSPINILAQRFSAHALSLADIDTLANETIIVKYSEVLEKYQLPTLPHGETKLALKQFSHTTHLNKAQDYLLNQKDNKLALNELIHLLTQLKETSKALIPLIPSHIKWNTVTEAQALTDELLTQITAFTSTSSPAQQSPLRRNSLIQTRERATERVLSPPPISPTPEPRRSPSPVQVAEW